MANERVGSESIRRCFSGQIVEIKLGVNYGAHHDRPVARILSGTPDRQVSGHFTLPDDHAFNSGDFVIVYPSNNKGTVDPDRRYEVVEFDTFLDLLKIMRDTLSVVREIDELSRSVSK